MTPMLPWKPIAEAPKDGRRLICWGPGYEGWVVLCWKHNRRIDKEYFGDPEEMDDYDLAEPESAPTHFIEVPPPPK